MNNKNLSKKKQKQLDRLNKSITYKKSEYPETGLPEKTDYFRVNRRYNIVCNNSVGGGDCHGDTFCLCKIWFYRPEKNLRHHIQIIFVQIVLINLHQMIYHSLFVDVVIINVKIVIMIQIIKKLKYEYQIITIL